MPPKRFKARRTIPQLLTSTRRFPISSDPIALKVDVCRSENFPLLEISARRSTITDLGGNSSLVCSSITSVREVPITSRNAITTSSDIRSFGGMAFTALAH